MKITTQILLSIAILLSGCNHENPLNEDELEIEIINQTIFELVPEYPDLFPIEYPYTNSKELQELRYDSALSHKKNQIDSLGIEICLDDELEIPNDYFLNQLKQQKEFEHTTLVGIKKKKINFQAIHSTIKTRIIPKSKTGDLPINNLGYAKYSRIFFNQKKNMAMFVFRLSGRTCTDGIHEFVVVKKEGNKWRIINEQGKARSKN